MRSKLFFFLCFYSFESWFDITSITETAEDIIAKEREQNILHMLHQVFSYSLCWFFMVYFWHWPLLWSVSKSCLWSWIMGLRLLLWHFWTTCGVSFQSLQHINAESNNIPFWQWLIFILATEVSLVKLNHGCLLLFARRCNWCMVFFER